MKPSCQACCCLDAALLRSYFVGSAVFHYLGPAFAVLLFARVEPLGVAWLRIASAAVIFAAVAPALARSLRDRAAARLGRRCWR